MKGMTKLVALLGRQLEILLELIGIESQKSQAIIQGNVTELDRLVNMEQSLVMKSANLEDQRQHLLIDLGLGDMSISQVIRECPGDESSGLEAVYHHLLNALLQLRKISDLNQKLLRNRLEVIEYVLAKTGLQAGENGTYENRHGTVGVRERYDLNGLLNKHA